MATIQVRNIPDDVHRTYRARAAAAGMSLQQYVRKELIDSAKLKTPAEIVAEVEEEMRKDPQGWFTGDAAGLVRADRESH